VYNRDQDLGNINPSTTTIRFKDGTYLGGDKIELSFNDKVLDYEVVLDDGFKEFELKLENGVNQLF
jgi:hypothetical protein